jgi:hypothetical protein
MLNSRYAQAPDTETWAQSLLEVCESAAGAELEYAEAPAALDEAQGAWGYRFRLAPRATSGNGSARAAAQIDDAWSAPLLARLATDPRDLEREAAAMALSLAHGCGGTEVREIAQLETADVSEPLWVLISDAPTGVPLPELIGFNLHHSEALLRGFAANHAAIHRLPVDDLGDHLPVPTVMAGAEVARIDAARFPAERRWLEEHLPAATDVALCHGGYQPMCVFGPAPSAWAEHGGPGKHLTVANWSVAVLAPRAFDVAFTLVAFWSAPFFAKNLAERTAIKMIRNTLLNTYTLGYPGYDELDPELVRFWRAFHTIRGMARLERAYDSEGSPFEAQDRGPLPAALLPELQRHSRQLTRIR